MFTRFTSTLAKVLRQRRSAEKAATLFDDVCSELIFPLTSHRSPLAATGEDADAVVHLLWLHCCREFDDSTCWACAL